MAENTTYPTAENITLERGQNLSSEHAGKRYKNLLSHDKEHDKPYFLFLTGAPGTGKSTAISKLKEFAGLDPSDAIHVSLDTLVESVRNFRNQTAKNTNKSASVYSKYMRNKHIIEMKKKIFHEAIKDRKNIIYEKTASKTALDDVFPHLAGTDYQVYALLTTADVPTVERRLNQRPKNMLKRNPPFYRVVAPKLARSMLEKHEEFLETELKPAVVKGQIEKIWIVDSTSSNKGVKITSFNGSEGGARKRKTRRISRSRGTRKH